MKNLFNGASSAEGAVEPRDVLQIAAQGFFVRVGQVHQFGLGFGKLTLHGARMQIVEHASPFFLQL